MRMINRIKELYSSSLRAKLLFWFLTISLVPLIWFTFISYEYSKKILINQEIKNLTALNLEKSQILDNYFLEKERTVTALARGLYAPEATEKFKEALFKYGKNSKEYNALKLEYDPIMEFRADILGYQNLFLVTKEGHVVYSEKESLLLGTNLYSEGFQGSRIREIIDDATSYLQTQVSSLTYYHPSEQPAFFIAAPTFYNNSVSGVVLIQINNEQVFKLATDRKGLGQTGESLLVTQIGNHILSLAPLLYDVNPQTPSLRIIPPNTPLEKYIKEVLNGERAGKTVVDYNNEETLMVGRYLRPIMHWGIITKINMTELINPVKKIQLFSIIMSLAIAGIVILFGTNIVNAITSPIHDLTDKTRHMSMGDLTQRISTKSKDEIGRLGQSFNEMAGQLENMINHLDSLVAKRTEKIKEQNERLRNTIDELQQIQSRLISQEKLASLGTLTAGIAHEIKNPLNFINNFSELCLQIDSDLEEIFKNNEEKFSEEDKKEIFDHIKNLKTNLSKIYAHGKRADSIVFNMLQHSRGAPGEKTATNINSLLDEYITLAYHGMRAQDTQFNVHIEKNYDKTLPAIRVVPQDLSRVFLNILNNAYYSVNQKIKVSQDDYKPTVKVTTSHDKNSVTINFWDNGLGFTSEVEKKIFTPFFTTKPFGEGTGLGLSLSYQIVVQGHKGTLLAHSEEGKFAEFTITIPY